MTEGTNNGVTMEVVPLRDRLLVLRHPETEKIGSIVVPDEAKEKPQRGEVVAVGTGRVLESGERIPLEVRVGDTILFGKYSGTDIEIEGEKVLIIREDEVLAIIRPAKGM